MGRGFFCIKVWEFALLILSQFCQISHENVTKLFHFHRIFKKWAALRGFERTPSGSATESLGTKPDRKLGAQVDRHIIYEGVKILKN